MKRPLTNMTIKEKAEEIFKETEHLKELLDEDKAAYDASFKDEKPKLPPPSDEELDRMHDQWDYENKQTEREAYENAH